MQFRALLPAVFLALTLVAAAPVAELDARAPMKYSGSAAPEDEAGHFPYRRAEGAGLAVPEVPAEPVDDVPSEDVPGALAKRIRYASIKRDGAAEDAANLDKRIRYASIKRGVAEDDGAVVHKRIRYAAIKREADEDDAVALDKRIRYAAIKRGVTDDGDSEMLAKRIRYASIKRAADSNTPRPAEANVAKRAAAEN